MNYEEFRKYIENDCMHEATYIDSEGREILVICLLDAYTMTLSVAGAHVREEREACAKTCEQWGANVRVDGWNMAAEDCANAIRARSKE